MGWLISLVVFLVLVGIMVMAFNKLRRLDIRAQEALGGIDVQLTRRADLIPNLVATVKGYASHEREVLEEVTAARAAVTAATRSGSVADKAAAGAALDSSLVNVLAVAEAYPELKAAQSYVALQQSLAATEDQLAFARQYYNDAVASLNTTVATFPWMIFAPMAAVRGREFYEALDADQAPPAVSF